MRAVGPFKLKILQNPFKSYGFAANIKIYLSTVLKAALCIKKYFYSVIFTFISLPLVSMGNMMEATAAINDITP